VLVLLAALDRLVNHPVQHGHFFVLESLDQAFFCLFGFVIV